MARLFRDDDADLALIQDRHVAMLGYDAQPAAQALCLRDCGVDVRIGLVAPGPLWQQALADGQRVVATYEACEEADLLVVSPEQDEDTLAGAVIPNLVAGDVLVLQGAAAVPPDPPAGVDIVRVAPWADGPIVREEFEQGRGVPVFASVVVDASGAAWETALAYARAIGATRSGVIRTTPEEYLSARREAESTLLRDAILPAIRRSFDSLVGAGCQPEVAYVLCIDGLRGFADSLAAGDLDAELTAARSGAGAGSETDPLPAAAALVRSLMAPGQAHDSRLH